MAISRARIAAILMVLSSSAACTHTKSVVADSGSFETIGDAAASDSDVVRVADAIARGELALEQDNAKGLMSAARLLSGIGAHPADESDNDLASLWADMATAKDPTLVRPIYRGRVLGPAYKKGVVSPNGKIRLEQLFLAGKKASIALIPAAQSNLSIAVKSAQGKSICVRRPTTKKASCRWLPVFTERYEIRIENKSNQSSQYHLVFD